MRQEYALKLSGFAEGTKTSIGGDLVLTRLERGQAVQRRVHSFPRDDWQMRQMLICSLHPYGQLGPCLCGSGQPYLVCHLRWFPEDRLCPCESGKAFADCHRIGPDTRQAQEHWRRHAKDFRRTRRELAEAYERLRPGENGPPPPRVVAS